jgi:trans-2,3-dihydro-3-hydroxyanthranilate isomerase
MLRGFQQVDVFSDEVLGGNPVAVVLAGDGLSTAQMQQLARWTNLSETTFLLAPTTADADYRVRIFTLARELPFAGHPTLGTAWLLRELGRIEGDELTQRSEAGSTRVTASGEELWFERSGSAEPDLDDTAHGGGRRLAEALGIDVAALGLEARELGRPGRLGPAFAEAGVRYLLVPLRDIAALTSCRPRPDLLEAVAPVGAYCFTAVGAGRVRARGFFPGVGVAEDPATGSAAAALGIYLAARTGSIRFDIQQGVEIGRPSRIYVRAEQDRVAVGGRCRLVFTGRLEVLP